MELEIGGSRDSSLLFNIWDKVWGCCRGSAEEAEKELDEEENEWWARRSRAE